MDSSRRFDRDRTGKKSGDHGIVANDNRAIATVNPSSPNQSAHNFRAEFPYKYLCSSLVS